MKGDIYGQLKTILDNLREEGTCSLRNSWFCNEWQRTIETLQRPIIKCQRKGELFEITKSMLGVDVNSALLAIDTYARSSVLKEDLVRSF